MAYILSGGAIRSPQSIEESNSTMQAQVRTLDGSINRDHFGSNKGVWKLEYNTTKKADYDVIKAIYDTYLATNNTVTWQSTETNYTIAQTNVHIDLQERGFSYSGEDYLSDFTVTLTEA